VPLITITSHGVNPLHSLPSEAPSAMRGPTGPIVAAAKTFILDTVGEGSWGKRIGSSLELAMNYQLHVGVRESRMRRCQSGNGAPGFR
jgi:hypothetical protein